MRTVSISAFIRLLGVERWNQGRLEVVMRTTRHWQRCAPLVLLALMASACATTKRAPVNEAVACPFLGLKLCAELTPGTGKEMGLRYINPNAAWTKYNKVMIAPVTFWAGEDSVVSASDQQALTNYFYQALREQMATQFPVVDQPGPGVMTVQVAIDDAQSAVPVLRTISIIVPQAHPLDALKYLATGTYPFAGQAQVEGKITDSMTGTVLAAGVARRIGGNTIKAAEQWQWGDVQNAMNSWPHATAAPSRASSFASASISATSSSTATTSWATG